MRKGRKIKNYTPTIDAELDLHGFTGHEARDAVEDFLHEASVNNWTRIRVVVGKGTRSEHGHAVLPNVVKTLLNQRGLTYTYAKLQDGGEGALEVSL
jgi:DNA-nicking Smr family endonuclease